MTKIDLADLLYSAEKPNQFRATVVNPSTGKIISNFHWGIYHAETELAKGIKVGSSVLVSYTGQLQGSHEIIKIQVGK